MDNIALPPDAAPFGVGPDFGPSPFPRGRAAAAAAVDRALGASRLQQLYAEARARRREGRDFCDLALETLGVGIDSRPSDVAAFPGTGPVVVVANRPFGPLDSLAVLAVLRRARPDVKLLGNELLRHLPELQHSVFLLEAPSTQAAARRNAGVLAGVVRWLRVGHVLAVSPVGRVARSGFAGRLVFDPGADVLAAWLARRTSSAVVPLCLHGAGGRALRLVGALRPRLQALVLPREVLRRRGSVLSVSMGAEVAPSQARWFPDDETLTAHLRARLAVLREALRAASRA